MIFEVIINKLGRVSPQTLLSNTLKHARQCNQFTFHIIQTSSIQTLQSEWLLILLYMTVLLLANKSFHFIPSQVPIYFALTYLRRELPTPCVFPTD